MAGQPETAISGISRPTPAIIVAPSMRQAAASAVASPVERLHKQSFSHQAARYLDKAKNERQCSWRMTRA